MQNPSGKARIISLYAKQRSDGALPYFCITSSCPFRIDLSDIILNGESYQSGSYLEIIPLPSKIASVEFYGKVYDAYLSNATFSDLKSQNFAAKKILASFREPAELHVQDATIAVMDSSIGESQSLSAETPPVLFSSKIIDDMQKHMNPKDKSEDVVGKDRYQSALNLIYGRSPYDISIESTSDFDIHCMNFSSIYSSSLELVEYGARGKLSVAYTPTPNEYDLEYQDVHLRSAENALSMDYEIETGQLSFYGYVDEATLAKINLFPDFWNWFFSNGYMAPVTLISTVITCVPLWKAKKDD